MDPALTSLCAALVTFVGTHFALSHPLRAPLASRLGEKGFLALYTLVALASFVWIVLAFRAAPPAGLAGTGEAGWLLATLLTLPASVLLAGALVGNPALPQPGAETLARREPRGVLRATRHPLMWSFALWAAAHLVLWWSWRTVLVALAMGFLALLGAHMQDRKKRAAMGAAWAEWEARTSYWLRPGALMRSGFTVWAVGTVLWLGFTWAHLPLGGVPAGIWRWTG